LAERVLRGAQGISPRPDRRRFRSRDTSCIWRRQTDPPVALAIIILLLFFASASRRLVPSNRTAPHNRNRGLPVPAHSTYVTVGLERVYAYTTLYDNRRDDPDGGASERVFHDRLDPIVPCARQSSKIIFTVFIAFYKYVLWKMSSKRTHRRVVWITLRVWLLVHDNDVCATKTVNEQRVVHEYGCYGPWCGYHLNRRLYDTYY